MISVTCKKWRRCLFFAIGFSKKKVPFQSFGKKHDAHYSTIKKIAQFFGRIVSATGLEMTHWILLWVSVRRRDKRHLFEHCPIRKLDIYGKNWTQIPVYDMKDSHIPGLFPHYIASSHGVLRMWEAWASHQRTLLWALNVFSLGVHVWEISNCIHWIAAGAMRQQSQLALEWFLEPDHTPSLVFLVIVWFSYCNSWILTIRCCCNGRINHFDAQEPGEEAQVGEAFDELLEPSWTVRQLWLLGQKTAWFVCFCVFKNWPLQLPFKKLLQDQYCFKGCLCLFWVWKLRLPCWVCQLHWLLQSAELNGSKPVVLWELTTGFEVFAWNEWECHTSCVSEAQKYQATCECKCRFGEQSLWQGLTIGPLPVNKQAKKETTFVFFASSPFILLYD